MSIAGLKGALSATLKSPGKLAGLGAGAFFGYQDYDSARKEGHGRVVSLAKAASEAILPSVLGFGGYLAFNAVTELPSMVSGGVELIDAHKKRMARENRHNAFANAQFSDTEQAFTMRQAGMQMAQRSRYNTQQAMLGSEAKYMRR